MVEDVGTGLSELLVATDVEVCRTIHEHLQLVLVGMNHSRSPKIC